MYRVTRLFVLALLCGVTAASGATAASVARCPLPTTARLLATDNLERSRVDARPLVWDWRLAAAAASYGPTLARMGRLQHSPRQLRPGQRENLWMGSRGAFSPEQMVGSWIEERNAFRPGV